MPDMPPAPLSTPLPTTGLHDTRPPGPAQPGTEPTATESPQGELVTTAMSQALTPRGMASLLVSTVQSWLDDRAPSMGAALAYYTLFSMAPLLLIAISLAGAVFGQDVARNEILVQLQILLGSDGANAVASLLRSVQRNNQSFMGTLIGAGVLLVGATPVFAELQDALDRIWKPSTQVHIPPPARSQVWWLLLRTRLMSFGLIVGIGFLLMVSMAVSAALAAWGRWWAPVFGDWALLLNVANHGFGFALTATLFASVYKFIPSQRVGWPDVWLGSIVTALLFTLGKAAIATYIASSGVASGFGAASAIVVLLVWVYWSAQVFLLGAEFTWVFAHRYGSRRHWPGT